MKTLLFGLATLAMALSATALFAADEPKKDAPVYELRIYYANEGKLDALNARFRDHTLKLFEKHGIKNVGYWTNLAGGQSDELYYLVAYDDLGARQPAWAAFIADPEWQEAFAESEKDGPLTHHTRNMLLNPTDFSPLA